MKRELYLDWNSKCKAAFGCWTFAGLFVWFPLVVFSKEGTFDWIYANIARNTMLGFLVLFLLSFLLPKRRIVRCLYAYGVSAIGAAGFLACFLVYSFLPYFFIQTKNPWLSVLMWLQVAAMLAWGLYNLYTIRERVAERKFVEKVFSESDQSIIKTTSRKHLESLLEPKKKKSIFDGALGEVVGTLLTYTLGLAFFIQRLLDTVAGAQGVFGFMGLLITGLLFYAVGAMTRGLYVNIYVIWKLEREFGKPVVFQEEESLS
jgi:hypothetical protein